MRIRHKHVMSLLLFLLRTSICMKCQHWRDVLIRWITVLCVTDHESAVVRLIIGQPLFKHTVCPYTIVPCWCWAGKVRLSCYKGREEFLMYSKVANTISWHCSMVNWNPQCGARRSGTDSVGRPSLELFPNVLHFVKECLTYIDIWWTFKKKAVGILGCYW